MYESLLDLFATNLQPHGLCLLWNPALLWLFMLSDGMIALAYYSIPISLFLFFKKRKDLSFGWLFMMFGAFILACGTTHFMSIVTLWIPMYWMEAGFKAFAAIISMVTAIVLWPQVPKLVLLPSPKQLEEINAKLALANKEYEEINHELQHRIREQEKAEAALAEKIKELTEAREMAESANRAKSVFLSNMSHELRTPLNAILGFAQVLRRSEELTDKQQRFVEIMHKSGKHLLDMINDVLDISKIESGRMEMQYVDFSLHALVDDICDMFEMPCNEKGLALKIEYDRHLPPVFYGDVKKLRQVLINLMGNAVKFTEKGQISLKVLLKEPSDTTSGKTANVFFEVSDTGRGIPANQLKPIFEPFRQVAGYYSEGTGLGLAISQRIIHMMGGEISVESVINQGSRFWFELDMEVAQNSTYSASETQDPGKITGIVTDRAVTVLIADDIDSNRTVLRAVLESVGFTCVETKDGREAIAAALKIKPDIIIMDIHMPVMDGIEALQAIRSHADIHSIPVIALSASSSDTTLEDIRHADFNAYLRKPLDENELFKSIAQWTGVEYLYGEQAAQQTQDSAQSVESIAATIHSLPEDISGRLADALEVQDFQQIITILSEIRTSDEGAYEKLVSVEDAARQSRFKTIVDLSNMLQSFKNKKEK